jgi:hypothetical protein
MGINLSTVQLSRWRRSVAAVAALGCMANTTVSRAGDGRGILDRQPSGPIFKTLDALAGGIELVLEKTVLGSGGGKRGCDAQACDDGCDAVRLHHLRIRPGSKVAVPEAYQPLHPITDDRPLYSTDQDAVPPVADVEPTFDRPARKSLPPQPAPMSEPSPAPTSRSNPSLEAQVPSFKEPPAALPQVPPEPPMPVTKQKPQSDLFTDEGWIDSFAPATPGSGYVPQRQVEPSRRPVPQVQPKSPPAELWSDPFQDDPQTRSIPKRAIPGGQSDATQTTWVLPNNQTTKAVGQSRQQSRMQ